MSDFNFNKYVPALKKLYTKKYFSNRNSNDPQRLLQFEIDSKFIRKFINSGNVCDVGCGTGEFLRNIKFGGGGDYYGIEINEDAKRKASDIINFKKNIFTEKNFFDLVIFRGTIQHVDIPLQMIKSSYNSLKKGGYIIFLATPNADSIIYKIFGTLPNLEPRLNFYVPSKKTLTNILINFNFKVKEVEFCYYNSPYRNLFKDNLKFLLSLFFQKNYKHAFYKNSMNISARK